MRAGHVMYVVDDLEQEVAKWEEKGFHIAYGSKDKHNALIFFSEGPYIELARMSSMNGLFRFLLTVMGGKSFIKRVRDKAILNQELGVLCIEKDPGDLEEQIAFLTSKGEKGWYFKKGKRIDLEGNILTWKLFFPNNLGLPFLMSYFDNGMNPKPKAYVHPNGIKKVKKIKYKTDQHSIDLLNEMVEDDTLTFEVGNQPGYVTSITFE